MDADIKRFLKYSTNIEAFIKDILNLECKPFHREWLRLFEDNRYVSLLAPRGHGKLLADSTPILTTNGWKTHGELIPGNFVYGPSGKPIQVIATSERTYADYLVETRDKEIIRCHGNHEWCVYDRNIKDYTIM